MKPILLFLAVASLVSYSFGAGTTDDSGTGTYEANWTSLSAHHTPQSIEELKFGIYCHWGAQTVQRLYENEQGVELSKLEAIEKWKGEHFDAKDWVDVFQRAGAQFGGPVAWHGTGLLNWDSELTEWNSVNHGPKVDIYGELSRELRKRDMAVISSFHTGDFWSRMWGRISWENRTSLDPYADNSAYGTMNDGRVASAIFDAWYDRITEAVDKYQPDMIWFDTGFGGTVGAELKGYADRGRLLPKETYLLGGTPERYQQKLIAHFFNKGMEWDKDVEFIYKSHDVPVGIGMRDIENGNLVGLQYDPWMADINMQNHYVWKGTWFYNPVNKVKDAGTLIDMLIDLTAKNGRMLLNVPPQADGTFAPEVKKELFAMGDWLTVNGEAIYGTMPWVFFGEGPTEVTKEGHHAQGKEHGSLIPQYTSKDIRFTQKGKDLYAIVMDWPGEKVMVRSLGKNGKLYPGDILSVSMLGTDDQLQWQQTEEGLVVQFPKEKPCDFAYVLKVSRR